MVNYTSYKLVMVKELLQAALKIAVDLVNEGMITKEQACIKSRTKIN